MVTPTRLRPFPADTFAPETSLVFFSLFSSYLMVLSPWISTMFLPMATFTATATPMPNPTPSSPSSNSPFTVTDSTVPSGTGSVEV